MFFYFVLLYPFFEFERGTICLNRNKENLKQRSVGDVFWTAYFQCFKMSPAEKFSRKKLLSLYWKKLVKYWFLSVTFVRHCNNPTLSKNWLCCASRTEINSIPLNSNRSFHSAFHSNFSCRFYFTDAYQNWEIIEAVGLGRLPSIFQFKSFIMQQIQHLHWFVWVLEALQFHFIAF